MECVLKITLSHVSMECVLRIPLSHVSMEGWSGLLIMEVSMDGIGCFKNTILPCVYIVGRVF